MPATGWANFLVPLFQCRSNQGTFIQPGQMWVNSYYAGGATVALAVAALWLARRRQRLWPMTVLAAVGLVVALGEATPVYGWLAKHLNVVGLMRFPVKFVILPVFVLPVLAALTLCETAPQEPERRPPARPGREPLPSRAGPVPGAPGKQSGGWLLGGVWLAVIGAILALTFSSRTSGTPEPDNRAIFLNGLLRAAYCTAIAALWFGAGKFAKSKSSLRWWTLVFLLLVWADLFQQMPPPPTVPRAAYTVSLPRHWTAPASGETRVRITSAANNAYYHFALSDATADYLGRRSGLMADCNLLENISKCDGFYPLYLSRYAALFYNFYREEQPAERLLDFLGVSQTLVCRDDRFEWQARSTPLPLLTAGQRPSFADDLAALQRLTNADFNPQREVVLPVAARPLILASNAEAVILGPVTYSAERIETRLETPAPTLVVAAQTYYPEWRAYVDGQPARLWPANYAFQAFEVPGGVHQVKLVYEDRRFRSGAAISLGTLVGCLAFGVWGRVRRNRGNIQGEDANSKSRNC
jgi:hypothetical protein